MSALPLFCVLGKPVPMPLFFAYILVVIKVYICVMTVDFKPPYWYNVCVRTFWAWHKSYREAD